MTTNGGREDGRGFLRIDETGRAYVLGAGLRKALAGQSAIYVNLPSESGPLLHFQRAPSAPAHDEFRAPIILQGDIAALKSTVEIINFVSSSKLSGSLVFTHGESRKVLYFKDGDVRGATSNRVEDRLGEVMYRYGALSREEIDRSLEECRRIRRPLGNYLLDQGIINQADLYIHVKRQVEEIFYSILLFQSGDFYLTQVDVDSLPSPLALSAQSMLMEGLRRMDEMAYFRDAIPDKSARIIARASARTRASALTSRERTVLDTLDAATTVEDLTRRCRLGEFETVKVLFRLLQDQLIEVQVEPTSEQTSSTTDLGQLVTLFNTVFERIHQAISRHERQDALDQGLETFLQFYGFVELFGGVSFDKAGRLDKQKLLSNLGSQQVDNPATFLSQALNELLFFEMFAAREWLSAGEQAELQGTINQLFGQG